MLPGTGDLWDHGELEEAVLQSSVPVRTVAQTFCRTHGVPGSDSVSRQRGESNMPLRPWVCATVLCFLAALPVASQPKPVSAIPHLERRGDTTQLIVDGRPFLALAGEL